MCFLPRPDRIGGNARPLIVIDQWDPIARISDRDFCNPSHWSGVGRRDEISQGFPGGKKPLLGTTPLEVSPTTVGGQHRLSPFRAVPVWASTMSSDLHAKTRSYFWSRFVLFRGSSSFVLFGFWCVCVMRCAHIRSTCKCLGLMQ